MVAIKTNIRIFLSLALMLCVCVAFADVTPRIAALEGDEQYMQLLRDVESMSTRENKLIRELDLKRELYSKGGADTLNHREDILQIEEVLLDLRVQRSAAINKINSIEQQWSLDNMGASVAPITIKQPSSSPKAERVGKISQSTLTKRTLPSAEIDNLRSAESLSQQLSLTVRGYVSNYQELARLKREYDQASSLAVADSVKLKYAKVDSVNMRLAKKISSNWMKISDSKGFVYALLMETSEATNYFEIEEGQKLGAAKMVDSLIADTKSIELLEYHSFNLSMVKLEIEVARHLDLPVVLDSLSGVRDSLRMVEFHYPSVELEERLFIDFEPIKFSSKAIYTGANPIPNGKIYERGVIYRLLVGKFKQRQAATLFRGAYPIYIIPDKQGLLCYYLGGYQTYEQAEEAREELLKRGFKRPEVVEWSDGVPHNITADGAVKKVSAESSSTSSSSRFRVEITGATELSDQVLSTIKTQAKDKELLKIGAKQFVVRSFDNYDSANQLVVSIGLVDDTLSVTVNEVKSN